MAEIVHALLSDAEVALFARFARACKLRAGQWLFQRGHRGERMYVILEGQIELDFGEDLVIKTLGQHEFSETGPAGRRSPAQRQRARAGRLRCAGAGPGRFPPAGRIRSRPGGLLPAPHDHARADQRTGTDQPAAPAQPRSGNRAGQPVHHHPPVDPHP
uniref:Cyclic nucleotide-binding domain-containing protein n=1 Tax=Panagrolaimus superbus TaxID=310955 RepID=A0A914YJH4_9BILA